MAKYKVGDKFIIEITKVSESYLSSDDLELSASKDVYYSIRSVDNKLWEHDLDRLERYTEEGKFLEGVKYAEKVYEKLHDLSGFELREIFKMEGGSAWKVIEEYPVQEIENMIDSYKPKFKVGDELLMTDSASNDIKRAVITYISDASDVCDTLVTYHVIFETGKTGAFKIDDLMKRVHKRVKNKPVTGSAEFDFESIFDQCYGKEV